MLIDVDIHSKVPVYLQIENHVKFAIASGDLKPMEKLPAVREVSEQLKINPNTVAKAYRDLEIMGLLATRRGMGIFVKTDIEEQCRALCRKEIFSGLHQVVTEAKHCQLAKGEITQILSDSYSVKSSPYGEPPASILALVRHRKKK